MQIIFIGQCFVLSVRLQCSRQSEGTGSGYRGGIENEAGVDSGKMLFCSCLSDGERIASLLKTLFGRWETKKEGIEGWNLQCRMPERVL